MMRRFLALLAVLALPAWADVARPESVDDTLRLLAEAYRETGLFDEVEIDDADQSVRLRIGDAQDYRSYPDNLHLILTAAESDAERQQLLDDFVLGMVESAKRMAEPPEPDPDIILPLVRATDFADGVVEDRPVSDPMAGDLSVFYAFDYPQSFAYVTEGDLEDMGIAREELAPLARANFQARDWAPNLEGDGIWMLTFDGNFEASFLLDEVMWNGFDEQLGTILMLALARDLILFTDADFDGAEAEMRRIATENFEDLSYPLSQMLFVWTDGGWAVR